METVLREGDAAQAGLDPVRIQRIVERAQSWVDDGLTPTLVLLAARRGVVVLHEAFGALTPEPDSPPLTVDSIFPTQSLCKPMTAATLLSLVEDGQVALNAPLVEYIPELEGDGVDQILVHQLLTHTSGFDDPSVIAYQAKRLQTPIDLAPLPDTQHKRIHLVLAARNGCPLSHAPEEVMQYASHGYELLGEVIRRVTGERFEDVVHRRILEPLGMQDSSYRLAPQFEGRMVRRAPLENPYGADLNDPRELDTPWAGGGLNSKAFDVARFAQMLLSNGSYSGARILSRASSHAMTHNQIPANIGEMTMMGRTLAASYGYGLAVFGSERWPMNGRLVPQGSYGHGGMGGSSFWVDPENEIVGVQLSVWVFPEDRVMAETPPKLSPAMFQDMVTAAVVDP